MVLGEELHTGGKALESDILAKRISFFRNLSEHVQLIGNRVVLTGSVQAVAVDDFYTVPQNKLFFMFTAMISERNIGAGNRSSDLRIKGESPLFKILNRADSFQNIFLNLNSPLILKTGEVLRLEKNNTLTGHEVNCHVVGYEINKEVLF